MRNQNASRGPLRIKVVIVSSLLLFFIAAISSGSGIYNLLTESGMIIENRSGSNVQFEQVTVDGQVIWKRPDLIIRTKSNVKKPYLDTTRNTGIMLHFRAPKRIVEVQLTVVTLTSERETVSCALDNRSRPCFFNAHYVKGKLHCGRCEDYLD